MRPSLFALFLSLSLAAFAQDSSFQLKDYKYRTTGFRALSFDIGLSAASSKNKFVANGEQKNSIFNLGPAALNYFQTSSTEKQLTQNNLALQSYFASRSQKDAIQKYTSRAATEQVSWSYSTRFYRPNKTFVELTNNVSFSNGTERSNSTAGLTKNGQLNFAEAPTVGFGKGRLEQVQDAQMALYLLNDLAASGLLTSPVTKEAAYQLASEITDIRNKRVFDSRRRRIYELTRLDSFLRSSGLAAGTSMRQFALINDNWAFAINPTRFAGSNWYIRLSPQFSIGKENRFTPNVAGKASYDFLLRTTTLMPVIGYENDRPINLKWQWNYGASVGYGKTLGLRRLKIEYPGGGSATDTAINYWGGSGTAFASLGYYPNTRTSVVANAAVYAYYNGTNDRSILPQLRIDANYFLGYRTFLTANISYSQMNSWNSAGGQTNRNGNTDVTFNLRLSHILY